ncbi:hypothetical protein GGU11DRAFT_812505, partial [Lentinula aff. detonsa]
MSATSSPTHPTRITPPVNDDGGEEFQAFLAKAQREAREKWEQLRSEKDVEKPVEDTVVGGVGELDITEGVEREIVPKVEAPRKKLVTRMIAVGPHNREVISIPKKRREVIDAEEAGSSRKRRRMILTSIVVGSDSDSLPLPFPHPCERCMRGDQVCRPQPNAPNVVACDRCHLARQSCSFLRKSKRS